jgi:hypothetical protein
MEGQGRASRPRNLHGPGRGPGRQGDPRVVARSRKKDRIANRLGTKPRGVRSIIIIIIIVTCIDL